MTIATMRRHSILSCLAFSSSSLLWISSTLLLLVMMVIMRDIDAKRLHKIEHDWDVFPVMPGRGTLRQLVRDVVNPYRFFVVYDTYSSSAPDGSSYSGGNTSFIEFDLEKQIDNVLAQIPLKEDMDDSDLLFTSIVKVESIPSKNRHSVNQNKKKEDITCFFI